MILIFRFYYHQNLGSGGATLNALYMLSERIGSDFISKRTLILHSGGYCQRLPHVASIGKAFMAMPDGRTFLEVKLESYRLGSDRKLFACATIFIIGFSFRSLLSEGLPSGRGFVFIDSSDVLENFDNCTKFEIGTNDIVLFAHESSIDIATQHGVYLVKNGTLESVLQKPSIEHLERSCSILENGLVLTDSCFLLMENVVKDLIKLRTENGIFCNSKFPFLKRF